MVPFLAIDHDIKTASEGCVADYCSFCYEIQVHVVTRFDWNITAYGFDSYDASSDYAAFCMRCGCSQKTSLDRYASILMNATDDVQTAINETYPNIMEVHSGRLQVEQRLRDQTASEVELLQRICDTIKFVDEIPIKIQDNHWNLPNCIFLSIVGAAVLGLATALGAPPLVNLDARNAIALGWLTAFLMVPALYFLLRRVSGRHERRLALQRVPPIALSLAPLRPSSDALDRALNALRTTYCGLATKISSDDILRAIKDLKTSSPYPFKPTLVK